MRFRDRTDAGKQLAQKLGGYYQHNCLVFALPRGGVPVGHEISRSLACPLDVLLVRKLGLPGNEEVAMGAVTLGDKVLARDEVIRMAGVTEEQFQSTLAREQQELARRTQVYRGSKGFPALYGTICILVDDGIATGATMELALSFVREENPARVVVAAPVMPFSEKERFQELADELVVLHTPATFLGVGNWYQNFEQTTDEEVVAVLEEESGRMIDLLSSPPRPSP